MNLFSNNERVRVKSIVELVGECDISQIQASDKEAAASYLKTHHLEAVAA